MDSDSLNERLDGRALAFVKTLKRRLMEAVSGHTDEMYRSREGPRTNDSMLWSFGRGPLPRDWSTTFVFLGYAIDQSRVDVEEVDPNFVM